MKNIIFSMTKSVQEHCTTFFWRFCAGISSFFWTKLRSERLFFYATVLLLGLGYIPNSYGQLVGEGGVKANFGVEADAYANFIGFSIVDPSFTPPPPPGPGNDFMNTDDWFEKKSGDPVFWPGTGRGVIDQTTMGLKADDPGDMAPYPLGTSIADIISKIEANSNFAFVKRQSQPPLSKVNTNGVDYLWIDAVYARDYNVVGIKGDASDKSFFTSGADKNADNPAGWTLGTKSGGPQKDDIIDAMAHLRGITPKDPTPQDPRPFTTLWAFGAATLRSTNGDKHIDFEFFRTLAKVDTALNKIVDTGNDGGRTAFTFYAGDDPSTPLVEEIPGQVNQPGTILVSTDYSGGGRSPAVEIRVWMKESDFLAFNNSAPGRPFNIIPGTFVKGTGSGNYGYGQITEKSPTSTPDIFGRVNVEGSTLATPWGTLEGEGADFSAEYLTLQHVEIGINLTAFGLDKKGGDDACSNILGSLLVKTRSSAGSMTSELKDFVGPFPFGNTAKPPGISPKNITECANAENNQTFNLNSRIDVTGSGTIKFYLTEEDRAAGTKEIEAADILAYPIPAGDIETHFFVRGSTSFPGCFTDAEFTIKVNANPVADLQTAAVCAGAPSTFTATPTGNGEKYTFWIDSDTDGVVDPGETVLQAESTDNTYDSNSIANGTVVTVLVKTTDGCTGYDTATAIVNANPVVDLQTAAVCAGAPATFTATPNGHGEKYTFWIDTDTDGVVDPGETVLQAESTDNTYDSNSIANGTVVTVLVKTTDGCTGYDTATAIVNANPTCSITGEQNICSGNSSTFAATPGMTSYSWTGPVGFTPATTQSIMVSIPGIYEVTITDGNGCTSKCSRELIIENCGHGCTPGYWQGKNNGALTWDNPADPIAQAVGFQTDTDFYSYFKILPGTCGLPQKLTMIGAIKLNGNQGNNNCAQLARGGTAAILNASTLPDYPFPTGITSIAQLKEGIEVAINSCNCNGVLASQIAMNNELNHDLCGTIATDGNNQLTSKAQLNTTSDTSRIADTNTFTASPVPFKDQLTISYNFDFVTDVRIEVFNTNGYMVAKSYDTNGYLNKSVLLNIPSTGQEEVYVVKVTTNRGSSVQKVISSR